MITKPNTFPNAIHGRVRTFFSSRGYLIAFVVLSLVVGTGAAIWKYFGFNAQMEAKEVDWRLLGQLDYITGKGSSEIESLDGKVVKIPGFMVPLEDKMRKVSEFLLVPSPQACIHVPPPPPNQMVFVKMEEKGAEPAYGPIWVYGTLRLRAQRHQYGEASFTLTGLRTTPYR